MEIREWWRNGWVPQHLWTVKLSKESSSAPSTTSGFACGLLIGKRLPKNTGERKHLELPQHFFAAQAKMTKRCKAFPQPKSPKQSPQPQTNPKPTNQPIPPPFLRHSGWRTSWTSARPAASAAAAGTLPRSAW